MGSKIKKGAKLTAKQKSQLQAHAKKYPVKHVNSMRMSMLQGKTVKEAHNRALKKKK